MPIAADALLGKASPYGDREMIEIGQTVYVVRNEYPKHLRVCIPDIKSRKVSLTSQVVSADKTEYILGSDYSEFVQEKDIYLSEEAAMLAARQILIGELKSIEEAADEVRLQMQDIDRRMQILSAGE